MSTLADIVLLVARHLGALKYNASVAELDTNRYTRQEIVDAINNALLEIGPFQMVDATVQTVANQESYILAYPSIVSIDRIRIGANTIDPIEWGAPLHHWWHNGNTLYFHPDYRPDTTGLWMQITYSGAHTTVSGDADQITDQVHPARLSWMAAYHAALQRQRTQQNDQRYKDFLTTAQMMNQQLAQTYPVRRVEKDSHFSTY